MAKKIFSVNSNSKRKNAPVVMPMTKNRKEHIRELSSVLANIFPSSLFYDSSNTLKTIAHEFNVGTYYVKQKSKSEDYQYFLENLFRYHKRKPTSVVLEIFKQGLRKLSDQGGIFQEEASHKIIVQMRALGFDIGRKRQQMVQPPLANVSVPPGEFAKIFNQLQLHPSLQDEVKHLYLQGHINEVVRKANEIYEHSQSDEAPVILPEPAEFEEDFIKLRDWMKE